MLKAKSLVLILVALTVFAFLTPFLRKSVCGEKYRGYFDRLEYAQYTPEPKHALAMLDSIIVPDDCLCSHEARKAEYQKYAEKAYFFSGVFNKNSHPDLDSTLFYCNKALAIAHKMKGKSNYVSVGDLYLLMGLTYEKLGDCDNALSYADKTIGFCKSKEDMLTMNNALSIKVNCLKALGRTEEVKSLKQQADSLSNILFQEVSGARH